MRILRNFDITNLLADKIEPAQVGLDLEGCQLLSTFYAAAFYYVFGEDVVLDQEGSAFW